MLMRRNTPHIVNSCGKRTQSLQVGFIGMHKCDWEWLCWLQVEAEIGRLGGVEDGLSVEESEAQLTDPTKANAFVKATEVDFLAVCIGNVHGQYPPGDVSLDLERLEAIRANVDPKCLLVLHGVSGLPGDLVQRCIQRGVCKLNVNTEVCQSLQSGPGACSLTCFEANRHVC